jgi:hypothetical protein
MSDWIEHPWDREDREMREAFAKKNAEIAYKNKLIIELADALADCGTKPYIDLLQRAREAVKNDFGDA